jgi:bifunctional DNase/RNase
MFGGRRTPEPIDCGPGPEEIADAADLADRVRRAVARLPDGQRAAVTHFYLSGLTYIETADLLGINVAAVKTRLHKARKTLKKQLWDLSKEEEMAMDVDTQPVEVRVVDVRRLAAEAHKPPYDVVVTDEIDGNRRLLMWIGRFEGTSIALHLEDVQVPRPLTFTFMANLLHASRDRLREVLINKLVDDTFYAVAVLEGPDGIRSVDARPSDALALALVAGVPIRVDPTVFDAAEAVVAAAHVDPPKDLLYSEGSQGATEIVAEITAGWPSQGSGRR